MRYCVILALLAQAAVAAAAAPPALQLAVSATDVRVANVTTGGSVVIYSAGLVNDGGLLRLTKVATILTDTDRRGTVTFTDGFPVPFRSVWIAVDLESGRYAVAGRDGYDLTVRSFPSAHLHGDSGGTIGLFDLNQNSGEMLMVEPKSGAWEVIAAEGGAADADRSQNGKLSLSVEDAVPLGKSGLPPKRLKNGDVVAVIDPHRLEVAISELDR